MKNATVTGEGARGVPLSLTGPLGGCGVVVGSATVTGEGSATVTGMEGDGRWMLDVMLDVRCYVRC